jgi:hypothetical protein
VGGGGLEGEWGAEGRKGIEQSEVPTCGEHGSPCSSIYINLLVTFHLPGMEVLNQLL